MLSQIVTIFDISKTGYKIERKYDSQVIYVKVCTDENLESVHTFTYLYILKLLNSFYTFINSYTA